MYQFKKHVVQEQNNQLVISLYLDTSDVEFAEELGTNKREHQDLEKSAKNYIQSKFPNLKNATVKIMAGTMLVSTLAFGAASLSPNKVGAEELETTPPATEVSPEAGGDAGEGDGEPAVGGEANDDAVPVTEGETDDDAEVPVTDDETDDDAEVPVAGDDTDDDEGAATDDGATEDTVIAFNDITGQYFEEPINVLVEKGIVKGVTKDAFVPYRDVTRAEAAAMLARALNLDISAERDEGSFVFTDVAPTSDFYDVIHALADANVIEGYDDDSFKPNQTITRAELAKMIASTYENIEVEEAADVPFTDVGPNSTFKDYIAAVHKAGITKGSTDTTFDPYKNTRRGEAATMIFRSINVELFGQADGRVPIEEVTDNSVTVNGKEFTLSNEMQQLFKESNKEILADSVVYLSTDKNDTVQKIRYLDIKNSGTEETPLILDGGNTVIHGDLILSGDYVLVNNLIVKGETIITGNDSKLTNDGDDENQNTPTDPNPTFDEAQFVYDVNVTEGEGNLRDTLLELDYESYQSLSDAQQTEVAKLFLLENETTEEEGERTKGFTTVGEIEEKLGEAITNYNQFLDGVNDATNLEEMKTALGNIAALFDGIEINDEMANKVLDNETDYDSVASIVTVLQAESDDGET